MLPWRWLVILVFLTLPSSEAFDEDLKTPTDQYMPPNCGTEEIYYDYDDYYFDDEGNFFPGSSISINQ